MAPRSLTLSKNTSLIHNLNERGTESHCSYDESSLIDEIANILIKKNITLVAHYYTPYEIQILAEETGGIVSDSLDMARYGSRSRSSTLLVAGVRFMGETAKILNPEKTISREIIWKNLELNQEEKNFNQRNVDVQITRLRKKIEPDPKNPRHLKTVRGRGYRFLP